MTPPPDALPACPHGHKPFVHLVESIAPYERVHIVCSVISCCGVNAPTAESARAAWTALCAPHALTSSRAEVERLRENLQRESRLACDLRNTQDEIIERCAKAVEEWPEAAARLRRHCGGSQDEYFAVSGEDFGEMRRTLDSVCRQYRALLLESDEATMRRAFGDESFERSVAAAKAVCERAIRAALSTAQQGASP